ncbi:hypothetical protein HA402_002206 [Bradysia odoriphaga]|nr:hypothetical protein HA402_002206 [Bradysia odoriphaga]
MFDDKYTPISEIPFPTITLCDPIKVSTKDFKYTDINLMVANSNHKFKLPMKVLQAMHSLIPYCADDIVVEYIKRNNITVDRDIWPHLKKISPEIWNASACGLQEYGTFKCQVGFTQVLWDRGVCHTFNNLGSDDVYQSNSLAKNFPKFKRFLIQETFSLYNKTFNPANITYPFRVHRTSQGIYLNMQFNKGVRDYDISCNDPDDMNSLLLFIHPAEDQFISKGIPVPLDHDTKIFVRPNMISTDKYLMKSLGIDKRKCVDIANKNEYKLKYFRTYSQNNCELEVYIDALLTGCNCSYFWMPRGNDIRICEATDKECATKVKHSYRNMNLTDECLPSCNSTTYDATMYTKMFSTVGSNWLFSMSITFDDQQYLLKKRSELYGYYDFFSDVAGTLSLFLGISFLSIAEIVYHASFRPFMNRRRKKTNTIGYLTTMTLTIDITKLMKIGLATVRQFKCSDLQVLFTENLPKLVNAISSYADQVF